MKALTFERFGGPEVLEYRDLPDPLPREGHAIVRTEGALTVSVAERVPLEEGARAHALLESRRTSGKILLIP